ncbi:MAG: hypothetical protein IJ574_00145 [Bacilli bacterium]|nr:hypothetical protein [Bacilli bacterium]
MNKEKLKTKKILVGICGIGNGHINRQICGIKVLLKNNYEVLVATESCKIQTIKDTFKNVKVIELNIPWIVCNENGFDFKETLNKYNDIDLFKKFLEFGNKIEQSLNGKPDLIISDYEPNVAQYAYATCTPLITMEQQSKFLYLEELKLKEYSIKEEIYRINYFFPKFDKKIISSFFPIDIKNNKIVQVSPIITEIKRKKIKKDFIIVYLSPYSDSDKYDKLINILGEIKNINFKVYSKNYETYINRFNFINVEFSNFNKNFKKDISQGSALITTGGHQLISEAISIELPLYVIPLNTYEQHYNAHMVNYYNLGSNNVLTKDNIIDFISKRELYRNNIKKYKDKYYTKKWENTFIDTVKELLNHK